jgi:hypothetical protein|tara:strand:+ start:185 stop:415 length:231 start_codon:yes stop_codon:yes gene_type:complete
VTEILIAVIGLLSATTAALIERVRRDNIRVHGVTSTKLDLLAKGLGQSIDRVREATERTEEKVDDHVADHAKGAFK